jgi:hypothetical protein
MNLRSVVSKQDRFLLKHPVQIHLQLERFPFHFAFPHILDVTGIIFPSLKGTQMIKLLWNIGGMIKKKRKTNTQNFFPVPLCILYHIQNSLKPKIDIPSKTPVTKQLGHGTVMSLV